MNMTVRSATLLRILVGGQGGKIFRDFRPSIQVCKAYTIYSKEPYNAKFVPLSEQSRLLPGEERARASKLIDDPYKFVEEIPDNSNVQTVYDVLDHGLKVSNDGDCIGTRSPVTGQYRWFKYSEVILKSQYIGSALMQLGLKPSNETFVGVFASNREEFLLTLYGCAGYSMVLVPLYESLGLQSVLFILKQVSFPVVIVNSNTNTLNIIKHADELPSLHTLVIMDQPTEEVTQAASMKNITILSYSELEEIGKKNKKALLLPKPDDLFCIPYTSGTTGIPKGVMLTHRNMIACVSSLTYGYGKAGIFGGTIMSYLPPAHIYEIANEVASLHFARRIAFYSGDIKKLMEEVKFVQPTILPLVPRLMNAIYTKTMESIRDSRFKTYLFKLALSRKGKLIDRGIVTNKSIWDKLVFKKFQEAIGGNVHMIITTSAPISPDIMKFFRCASGCYLFEAYGQTEVLAATMSLPNETGGGHVGVPLPSNHIKLVDVPEMGYFAKDDAGEVCFKGSNVFKGYFKNPEATNESLEESGWHHSGDIGRWLPNGALKIIDRKKHLFKLSQGEYIAPEKVENAYSHSKYILQIYVDGLSNQDYVIALVVPEPTNFKQWLKSKGFKYENMSEVFQNKDVRRAFLLDLHEFGKHEDLNALEQAKSLAFLSEPFSIENDLLTPTLKLRRIIARKKFETLLEQLYQEGPLIKSTKCL